jgi:outer membrane protein OmpA-like peptidoglycan-associated protein
MLKQSGQYEQAMKQFKKFMDDNPKKYKKLKKQAQKQIDGCEMAIKSMKEPGPYTVVNCGPNVNSSYTELSPYPLGDTALMFATMRPIDYLPGERPGKNAYLSHFMTSRKFLINGGQIDTFQWALRYHDMPFIVDNTVHIGNGCYSPQGERFYFTVCKETDSMKTTCTILVSNWDTLANRWEAPEPVGSDVNAEGSSNTQPYVTKVGKKEILFFASDRKLQSRGRYDIWYSVIDPKTRTYRRPQNCGKQVNTEYNEMTPYYDNRVNKLYFSSDGQKGFGGFDVFEATGGPSRYTNVQNMGYPINSPADELYFIKDPMGKPDCYLVSNRIGSYALKNPTCCDDIWRVQVEPKLLVKGQVINKASQSAVMEVVVKMTNEQGEVKIANSSDSHFTFSTPRGHSYVFTADKPGFASSRQTVSTMDVKRTDPDDSVLVTIYLDSVSNKDSFSVNNVYFDYNKDMYTPESQPALDSLANFLKDNPALSVEIYSFTDGKGQETYNNALSVKRSENVMKYLVGAGIEAGRMIVKGLGKKNPVAQNEINGKDNPEGRKKNRRTEFRITSDIGNKHIIYNSRFGGTIGDQAKNLEIKEDLNEDTEKGDSESDAGSPGSRVHKKTTK